MSDPTAAGLSADVGGAKPAPPQRTKPLPAPPAPSPPPSPHTSIESPIQTSSIVLNGGDINVPGLNGGTDEDGTQEGCFVSPFDKVDQLIHKRPSRVYYKRVVVLGLVSIFFGLITLGEMCGVVRFLQLISVGHLATLLIPYLNWIPRVKSVAAFALLNSVCALVSLLVGAQEKDDSKNCALSAVILNILSILTNVAIIYCLHFVDRRAMVEFFSVFNS